jgi:hypothetical protein
MRNIFWGLLVCFIVTSRGIGFSQNLEPGLPGMAPTKWITIKNTQAPRRSYQSLNSQSKSYTQEDLYFRAWFPVIMKSKFALALGPHYRIEQLEFKTSADDQMHHLSNWSLRSMGIDMKSCVKLDSNSWFISTAHISQSGNLNSASNRTTPVSYTFSFAYLKKKSINKEIGFGLMVNKSSNFMILPVFVFNYNYSTRFGIEISLPHRLTWRYNISSSSIIYLKSEVVTRTYFLDDGSGTEHAVFRRIDVDNGIAYNKQFNRFIGIELFGGYRQNLSYNLPYDLVAVKNSGWAASFELYIRPPEGLLNRRK